MPRTVSGLGAGSKVPLRGFTQLLKNLPAGTRAQLEQAFGQAEDLIDFHSRTVPELQTKRRLTGLIQVPVLTVEETIIGAFVTWDRLDDPRISFYEVQLSDDSTFASPETFQTLEAFFAVENVVTTKFIRVRGVRADGDAGLFSDTSRVRPTVTAPTATSFEFYPGYFQDSLPELGTSLAFGKNLDEFRAMPTFYTVLEETFYADRLTGGFSVWGMISNRLRRFQDAGTVPWDRIRFKLNGVGVMDGYFPHWTNTMDETAEFAANRFDRTPDTNELLSFYSLGGYTAAFGPYNVLIPSSFAGEGPNDPNRVISLPDPTGIFYWTDFNNTRLPSRFDQAQFQVPATEDKFPGTTDRAQHEAAAYNLDDGDKTDFIYFHDFKFNIPEDRVLTGIKAEVSRRQPALKSSIISPNFGNTRPDRTPPTGARICETPSTSTESICDDVIMNYTTLDGGGGGTEVSEKDDILEDVNFGRFLDVSRDGTFAERANRGPLSTDARGADEFGVPNFRISSSGAFRGAARSRMIGDNYTGEAPTPDDDIPNRGLSISMFVNINSLAFVGFGTGQFSFAIFCLGGTGSFDNILVSTTVSEVAGIIRYVASVNAGLSGTNFARIIATTTGTDTAFDKFHHLCLVWRPTKEAPNAGFPGGGDADDLELYLNGLVTDVWSPSVTRSTSIAFTGFKPDDPGSNDENAGPPDLSLPGNRGLCVGENSWLVPDSDLPGKVAQLAIWDRALLQTSGDAEVSSLTEGVGRADYRFDFSEYRSSDRLSHYFLFFPDQPDIQDCEVFLVDQGPNGSARIRDDLENKAVLGESWPQLGDFFYTDARLFGFLPVASSNGIPHDNHTAIGYQSYGAEGDLWGQAAWTPSEVNNFYFGFALRAINEPEQVSTRGHAFIDHARMTLFFAPEEDRSVRATVEASVSNQFYLEREVFGALFNVIEIGERLADLPDC